MCGIAGLIDRQLAGNEGALARAALAMSNAIAHRGPDGEGIWVDAKAGVALSHRRLSIIDLTAAGAQPMLSTDGRFAITYNGEIYNAEDLRRHSSLAKISWRGHSDTEVLVESFAHRGIPDTLRDLNGMYALALWDRRERSLHLVRDRLGIKPLFMARQGANCYFASELKGLHATGLSLAIDPASVTSFLRYGYVPSPHTIYSGVAKVLPGEHVTIAHDGQTSRRLYWSVAEVAARGVAKPLSLTDDEAIEHLAALAGDAVSRQMLSDVPLGAFLSGGIDSSTVAGFMVAARRGPVRTFSIGFPDLGFDESREAAAVARHLGTDHTELIVTARDALSVVPQLSEMYDEPFADSSQIPTYLVSNLTRQYVTVALSGDGGDELFAGYNRYRLAEGLWSRMHHIPEPVRRMAAHALDAVPMPLVDTFATLIPRGFRPTQPADKLRKFAHVLALDEAGVYQRLVSQYEFPADLSPLAAEHPGLSWTSGQIGAMPTSLDRMQLLDLLTYLPGDILQKVDRASMAVALEVRPPLLDHRIVEFAWALPRRFKIRNGQSKWILRRVAERMVPQALLKRPKMGFGIPLADWLRGPLRDWAEDLLEPSRLGGGLLDVAEVRRLWSEHLGGGRNWAYALWTVLMFEAWRRRWSTR